MTARRNERGLTGAVQAVVLFPLALGVFLALLQWALYAWAESTALAAAHEGASVAAALDGSVTTGRAAATRAADNGSLSAVAVDLRRGRETTEATVSGRVVAVLWTREVSATARVTTERLTR